MNYYELVLIAVIPFCVTLLLSYFFFQWQAQKQLQENEEKIKAQIKIEQLDHELRLKLIREGKIR